MHSEEVRNTEHPHDRPSTHRTDTINQILKEEEEFERKKQERRTPLRYASSPPPLDKSDNTTPDKLQEDDNS